MQWRPLMPVEPGPREQRYKAVREVLDGATVFDVAQRSGVARQTVNAWLRRYANGHFQLNGPKAFLASTGSPDARAGKQALKSRPVNVTEVPSLVLSAAGATLACGGPASRL
jgi:transposase-like protein